MIQKIFQKKIFHFSMNIYYPGLIKNGKIVLDDRGGFQFAVNKLEGKRVQVLVRKQTTSRSYKQNRLYWLYLTFIGQELGYETEELHSTFKAMFLTDRSGKMPIVRSTTSLTTDEFGVYTDKIKRKVAEMGIVLPDPEQTEI